MLCNDQDNAIFCGTIGTAYCGSTILSFILGSSKDVFSTGELNHIRKRGVGCCSSIFHPGEKCLFWTREFAEEIKKNQNIKNKLLKDRARSILGSKVIFNADKGPHRYIDSHKSGDDVDFIVFLFKKPQAFAFSYTIHQRRGWKNDSEGERQERERRLILDACNNYCSVYSRGIKFVRKNNIPHVSLSFDDLSSNTINTVKSLCDTLKVDFSEDMIEYWNNKDKLHMVSAGNVGAWKQFGSQKGYNNYWTKRMDGSRSYSKEHSEWFMDNYHKISSDEKWKQYFSLEQKELINTNKVMNIYNDLMRMKGRIEQ